MSGTDREIASEISDAELFAFGASGTEPEPAHDEISDLPPPAKEEVHPAPQQAAPDASPQAEAPQPHRVPLSELLDERERRQAAAREAEDLRRQHQELQRQLEELRQPKQQIDPFADPEGYQRAIDQRIDGVRTSADLQRRVDIMNLSFDMASETHGDKFKTALEEFAKAANPAAGGDERLRSEMLHSPNPARFVMQWHGRNVALREVGTDVEAYRARIENETRERLRSDPEFRRQIVDELRAEAGRRPPVTMPSLNRASSAAPLEAPQDEDLGDGALFRSVMPRRR